MFLTLFVLYKDQGEMPSKRLFARANKLIRITPPIWDAKSITETDSIFETHGLRSEKCVGIVWKHPVRRGCCLVFSTGKLSVMGKASSLEDSGIRAQR